MPMQDDFVDWAMGPAWTLEERCAIEKAVEWGDILERRQRALAGKYTVDQQRERHKARRLNPAYEPALKADEVRRGAVGLLSRKDYSVHGYQVLELRSIFSLEGMERYPKLVNLTVAGPFRDVQPLTACRALTHLWLELSIHLHLDVLRDVAPLAALPELRFLQVRSQRPRDYSALIEAPRLHEVSLMASLNQPLQACAMEQAALNATLEPWDTEFLRPNPRPLAPPRVGFFDPRKKEQPPDPPPSPEPPPVWDQNPGFRESEGKWLRKRLAARLCKRLERDGPWGEVRCSSYALAPYRGLSVTISSQEAAESLRDVIEIIRTELTHTHCPWTVGLTISLEIPPVEDLEETPEMERLRDQADKEERERQLKEEAEFLERKHRLELQKEAGTRVRPEDFAAPGTVEPPVDDEETARTAADELRELIDQLEPERSHPLADRYHLLGTIHEGGAFFYEHFRQTVEWLLGGNSRP